MPLAKAEPMAQADYDAIEAAVMETARGRWFLAEYGRRQKAADTQSVLTAIARLEALLLDRPPGQATRLEQAGAAIAVAGASPPADPSPAGAVDRSAPTLAFPESRQEFGEQPVDVTWGELPFDSGVSTVSAAITAQTQEPKAPPARESSARPVAADRPSNSPSGLAANTAFAKVGASLSALVAMDPIAKSGLPTSLPRSATSGSASTVKPAPTLADPGTEAKGNERKRGDRPASSDLVDDPTLGMSRGEKVALFC